ncbi:hypothetical protein [Labrys wisconsinensis]|uniref:Glutamine amidotransferase domain-containing protein n=1 Tax=Labrys wisconsinensis TaxID=425677 RepID=A0ABU0JH71_9HYPH|nr:hypothetical protein [Labrys wisconsinensis]
MAGLSLSFSPFLPWPVLWAVAAVAGVVALLNLGAGLRGAIVRALALALAVLALANPSVMRQDRETLPNVVAVVLDRSASQGLGERTAQTDAVRDALAARLKGLHDTEVRMIDAGANGIGADGTQLFGALANALGDVPPERVGGAIIVTDGEVDDVPAKAAALGFSAPVHALITGHADERDRRIALVEAPRFGIVGKTQTVRFRVIDHGPDMPGSATVVVRRDGEEIARRSVAVGAVSDVDVEIAHGGANIVELDAEAVPGELTDVNNKAVLSIEGIRDKMRVLLVSGEPHAGERTWRNLLKADANVELVHFTILRPPHKQDGTPINELSLIAFPTRTLFAEKISDFDLIIFDRYAQEGILPQMYFDNITEYVRNGGAVMLASGPDYASDSSLWGTSLADILPAEPTGGVIEQPFRPKVTDLGKRHPVTRDLPGSTVDPPAWSEWFRTVETTQKGGTEVMSGAKDEPLLVLSRQQKGRVAMLLSDHVWLWARGFEGGGPYVDLLRRLSHWLMKEPDLEEEALRASARGADLLVERQTMADTAAPVTVTGPTGEQSQLQLKEAEPGLWRGTFATRTMGLWRVTDGTLTALANVGPANPREFQEVVSTEARLAPLTEETHGTVRRVADPAGGSGVVVPRVALVSTGSSFGGEGWIGFKQADVSVVRGVGVLPLFGGLLGLALLLGALAAMWAREGWVPRTR